jgi:uncharacterized membrane protein YkvA (DUF1232 family)
MHTVGDIRRYLSEQSTSPEALAKSVGISNMTVRRMLKKTDEEKIPAKYLLQFSSVHAAMISPSTTVMEELERAGRTVRDQKSLEVEYGERIRDKRIHATFLDQVGVVADHAFRHRSVLALGAILYFVNPLDMIPDFMGPMGLVDDFGVVALVYAALKRSKK